MTHNSNIRFSKVSINAVTHPDTTIIKNVITEAISADPLSFGRIHTSSSVSKESEQHIIRIFGRGIKMTRGLFYQAILKFVLGVKGKYILITNGRSSEWAKGN